MSKKLCNRCSPQAGDQAPLTLWTEPDWMNSEIQISDSEMELLDIGGDVGILKGQGLVDSTTGKMV